MADPSLEVHLPEKMTFGRLDSWKEIASFLNRDVTTVQRWEKRESMPVHRHLHDKRGSVYALRSELDAWARTRNLRETEEEGVDSVPLAAPPIAAPNSRWKRVLPAAGAVLVLVIGIWQWVERSEFFWRDPIENAKYQTITDFGGEEQAAAVSRDGNFIAFLSDRDGHMDVWVTQVGSGQYHNLTRGSALGITNPSLRSLGFSPDGTLVTYWERRKDDSRNSQIGVRAVPTLGGEPRPYLDGAAEFDWTSDSSQLAYHTPESGDPLFIVDGILQQPHSPIYTAPAGLHAHFPLWSPDAKFIYFVQGSIPDRFDIWRVPAVGGKPERITTQNTSILYPVFLDARTLIYLATEPDGSGPWLYSLDVKHRFPHRLGPSLDRYTSLAASADGRRLVATLARQKRTLWRLQIANPGKQFAAAVPVPLTTGAGFSPRLGRDFLLYVSKNSSGESLWKRKGETTTELWHGQGALIIGGPAISQDGRYVAFSAKQENLTRLYVIQADGTNARMITSSLSLQGDLAWAPDGQSIVSAVIESGEPHLFRIPVNGGPPVPVAHEYSLDPAWAPDGEFMAYSGPDVGTTFSVKAITADHLPHDLPAITLTRGARHLAFLPGGHTLVVLRGEIQHKNLWLIDLDSTAERQLTELPLDFDIQDFDISPDGHEVVVERAQESSDVVLIDLPRR